MSTYVIEDNVESLHWICSVRTNKRQPCEVHLLFSDCAKAINIARMAPCTGEFFNEFVFPSGFTSRVMSNEVMDEILKTTCRSLRTRIP